MGGRMPVGRGSACLARLPNRASTVGVWILPVVLFIIGAALILMMRHR